MQNMGILFALYSRLNGKYDRLYFSWKTKEVSAPIYIPFVEQWQNIDHFFYYVQF